MRFVLYGLALTFAFEVAAEDCPDPEASLVAGAEQLFSEFSDRSYVFPLEPTTAIFIDTWDGPSPPSSQYYQGYALSTSHFKILASGLVSIEFLDSPAQPTGIHSPGLQVVARLSDDAEDVLGDDLAIKEYDGTLFAVLRSSILFETSGPESVDQTRRSEGRLLVSGTVRPQANPLAARVLTSLGLPLETLKIVAIVQCGDLPRDFLGAPLINVTGAGSRDIIWEWRQQTAR